MFRWSLARARMSLGDVMRMSSALIFKSIDEGQVAALIKDVPSAFDAKTLFSDVSKDYEWALAQVHTEAVLGRPSSLEEPGASTLTGCVSSLSDDQLVVLFEDVVKLDTAGSEKLRKLLNALREAILARLKTLTFESVIRIAVSACLHNIGPADLSTRLHKHAKECLPVDIKNYTSAGLSEASSKDIRGNVAYALGYAYVTTVAAPADNQNSLVRAYLNANLGLLEERQESFRITDPALALTVINTVRTELLMVLFPESGVRAMFHGEAATSTKIKLGEKLLQRHLHCVVVADELHRIMDSSKGWQHSISSDIFVTILSYSTLIPGHPVLELTCSQLEQHIPSLNLGVLTRHLRKMSVATAAVSVTIIDACLDRFFEVHSTFSLKSAGMGTQVVCFLLKAFFAKRDLLGEETRAKLFKAVNLVICDIQSAKFPLNGQTIVDRLCVLCFVAENRHLLDVSAFPVESADQVDGFLTDIITNELQFVSTQRMMEFTPIGIAPQAALDLVPIELQRAAMKNCLRLANDPARTLLWFCAWLPYICDIGIKHVPSFFTHFEQLNYASMEGAGFRPEQFSVWCRYILRHCSGDTARHTRMSAVFHFQRVSTRMLSQHEFPPQKLIEMVSEFCRVCVFTGITPEEDIPGARKVLQLAVSDSSAVSLSPSKLACCLVLFSKLLPAKKSGSAVVLSAEEEDLKVQILQRVLDGVLEQDPDSSGFAASLEALLRAVVWLRQDPEYLMNVARNVGKLLSSLTPEQEEKHNWLLLHTATYFLNKEFAFRAETISPSIDRRDTDAEAPHEESEALPKQSTNEELDDVIASILEHVRHPGQAMEGLLPRLGPRPRQAFLRRLLSVAVSPEDIIQLAYYDASIDAECAARLDSFDGEAFQDKNYASAFSSLPPETAKVLITQSASSLDIDTCLRLLSERRVMGDSRDITNMILERAVSVAEPGSRALLREASRLRFVVPDELMAKLMSAQFSIETDAATAGGLERLRRSCPPAIRVFIAERMKKQVAGILADASFETLAAYAEAVHSDSAFASAIEPPTVDRFVALCLGDGGIETCQRAEQCLVAVVTNLQPVVEQQRAMCKAVWDMFQRVDSGTGAIVAAVVQWVTIVNREALSDIVSGLVERIPTTTPYEFAAIISCISKCRGWERFEKSVEPQLMARYENADPHSQCLILRAISTDEHLADAHLATMLGKVADSLAVVTGEDLELVAAAALALNGEITDEVDLAVRKAGERYADVCSECKASLGVRVLQLMAKTRVEGYRTSVFAACNAIAAMHPLRLDPPQVLSAMQAIAEMELRVPERLLFSLQRCLRLKTETMSAAQAAAFLAVFVDLEFAYTEVVESLFFRANEQKDNIFHNADLEQKMEYAAAHYVLDASSQLTNPYLKKKRKRDLAELSVLREAAL